MPNIVILEGHFNALGTQMSSLRKLGNVTIVETCPLEQVIEACKDTHIVIVNSYTLTKEFFAACPTVKFIVKWGVGVNNIDMESATDNGVIVCNCPHYGDLEVAEFALLLTLASLRKFIPLIDTTKQRGWVSSCPEFTGRSLRGLTVGVIGFGRIGKAYINMLRAFQTHVVVYSPNSTVEKELYPHARQVQTIHDVLTVSDVVSLHSALNHQTYHMIGEQQLQSMKKQAIIVNVARGALVEENAILQALNTNTLGGYSTDVFELEPLNKNHPFINHPKVIASPHYAYIAKQSLDRLDVEALKSLENFVKGRRLVNVVNAQALKQAGYTIDAHPYGYLPYPLE